MMHSKTYCRPVATSQTFLRGFDRGAVGLRQGERGVPTGRGSGEEAAPLPRKFLDFPGNSAIRSADPENPTLEQNMKWIGRPVVEIWAIQNSTPFFREGRSSGVVDRQSPTVPLERAILVSYSAVTIPILTIALHAIRLSLSLSVQPHIILLSNV